MEPKAPELVCPYCHGRLEQSSNELRCVEGHGPYAVRDGIPCFAPADQFYELRYENQSHRFVPDPGKPWHVALLYLTTQHYLWYIHRFFRHPGTILDVACGGGVRYLASKGEAVGMDVSLQSVKSLDPWYKVGIQGDAFAVPYPDESFDFITGKCIFEHIPVERKPALLQEFRRLLKPGGRLLLLFDTENVNPLWLWAKRDPLLFQKAFIDHDGHYGLMYPRDVLAMLEREGFSILSYHGANKTPLVHLSMLVWLRAYAGKSRLLDAVTAVAEALSDHRLLTFAYTFLVTLWDDLVERLFDLDRARYLLVVCEKAV